MEEDKHKCGRKRIYNTPEEKKKAHSVAVSRKRKEDIYKELLALCKSRNATMLSEQYESAFAPLKIKCVFGHTFEVCSHHIKIKNAWCKRCYERIKKVVSEGKQFIENGEDKIPVYNFLYIVIKQEVKPHKDGKRWKYSTDKEAREAKRKQDRQYYYKNRESELKRSLNTYYKKKLSQNPKSYLNSIPGN